MSYKYIKFTCLHSLNVVPCRLLRECTAAFFSYIFRSIAAIRIIIYREILAKLDDVAMSKNMSPMGKQYIHPRIHT
jgi:hypothetical protein